MDKEYKQNIITHHITSHHTASSDDSSDSEAELAKVPRPADIKLVPEAPVQ